MDPQSALALEKQKRTLSQILKIGIMPIHTSQTYEGRIHKSSEIFSDGIDASVNFNLLNMIDLFQNVGIRCIEMPIRVPNALQNLEEAKKKYSDYAIGAGSCVDEEGFLNKSRAYGKEIPTIQQLYDIGIDFLVSSTSFRKETIEENRKRGIVSIPGVATSEEAKRMFSYGANIIKVFHIEHLGGSEYVKQIDGPLHKCIPFMPTGGDKKYHYTNYLKNGCLILAGSYNNFIPEVNSTEEEFKDFIKTWSDMRMQCNPNVDFEKDSLEEITQKTGRIFI